MLLAPHDEQDEGGCCSSNGIASQQMLTAAPLTSVVSVLSLQPASLLLHHSIIAHRPFDQNHELHIRLFQCDAAAAGRARSGWPGTADRHQWSNSTSTVPRSRTRKDDDANDNGLDAVDSDGPTTAPSHRRRRVFADAVG